MGDEGRRADVDVPGVTVSGTPASRADAMAVRHEVSVEERGVSAALEIDDHDEDPATTHLLAYDGTAGERAGDPIGAARLRPYGKAVGKVERVAVRESRRGEGIGRRLMCAVERTARDRGFERLRLNSQVRAIGFYEGLGYEVIDGEPFTDAGIPRRSMAKGL